jgi:hypothetical protein
MALISEGTILRRGDGDSSETFSPIGEVTSASGLGGGSPTVIDVSHLGSSFREKVLGLRDEGQISMTLQWAGDDTTHQGLWNDRATGALRNFELQYPDGTLDSFSAFVMTFESNIATDAAITVNVTLEITGQVLRNYDS